MTQPRAVICRLIFALILSLTAINAFAENYTLDMRGADIREFINSISKMTGKTIITDSKVRGNVDIQSPSKLTEEELYEIFLVQMGINGYSVVDTGNNILKVIPAQGAKLEGGEVSLNQPLRSSEEVITRVVQVDNVNATQLAATLRPLVDSRLGVIAAYPTSNVILLTDRASNVRRIAQIVVQVDRADSQSLEVITLNNASAAELERILTNVTNETKKEAVGPAPVIVSDQRTNTLVVRADATTRSRIRRIVRDLDNEVETVSNTRVVYLKYANAKELVPVLKGVSDTIIKEKTSQGGNKSPALASQTSLHLDAHEQTNSIVMSGNPHIIRTLEGIIEKLDIRRAQVLVEAIIAEVSDNIVKELGVQWLFFGGQDNQTVPLGAVDFGSDSRTGIGNLASSAVNNNASIGLINNGISLGVGKYDPNGFSFAAFLTALDKDSNSNILSTPSLMTMDNEEAYIQVGQEVPFITGSTTGDNNSNPFQTIERKDIGVKLKVTPQINEGDAIKLDIEQEVSSLSGVQASDIVTNKRVVSTTVLVDDGAVLALGGLIEEDIQESTSKVPVLGDVPLVGRAFRSDDTRRTKRNLMVFIRPTIVRNPQVANSLSREKYNYIHAHQILSGGNNPITRHLPPTTVPAWGTTQPPIPATEKQPSTPTKTPVQKTQDKSDFLNGLEING